MSRSGSTFALIDQTISNYGRVGHRNWKIPSICTYNSTKASSRKSNAISCADISFQFHYWDWDLDSPSDPLTTGEINRITLERPFPLLFCLLVSRLIDSDVRAVEEMNALYNNIESFWLSISDFLYKDVCFIVLILFFYQNSHGC